MSALPPKADIRPRDQDVCFGPKADSCSAAKSRYSITSSARANGVGGTSIPSAFAVLRLITNSNLVDCTYRTIVFLTVTDPLGQGLLSSLAHPGGNITGFSVFEVSLGTKWLEIPKQIAPGVRRVTAMFNPETAPYYGLYLQSIDAGTSLLGIESIPIQVHSQADIENVIRKVGGEPDSGLFVLPDSHNIVHRKRIIELTAQYRLPAVYYFRYFATDGGLISYGPDEMDLFRRTAGYVDQILKGARPSDLPVQQPAKFELVINLTTAKALGLTIPPGILSIADDLVE
jgi:putative tryptophan/tyrosine transport system substrate-binding protein